MYRTLDSFATNGIGEPENIKDYVNCKIRFIEDFRIIDVRNP